MKQIFVVCLVVLINSCTKNVPTIKIGINPWPGYEPLAAAQELGLFKKHGLNVQFYEYTSLSDVKSAMERSQIDIMCSTIIEILTAYDSSGTQLTPLIISDYSNGPDVIVSSSAKNIKELKGKKIGLEIGSLGIYILGRALELNELSLSEVNLVPLDQTSLKKAFIDKKIEAAVTYPPTSIELVKNEIAMNIIFSSQNIPYEIIDVISINSDLYKKYPAIKEKILRVWDEIIHLLKTDPEKVIPLMAKRENLSIDDYKKAMEGLIFLNKNEQNLMFDSNNKFRKLVEETSKTLHKFNIIKKPYKYIEIIEE